MSITFVLIKEVNSVRFMTRSLPKWAKEARKAMIDRDMNIVDLSDGLGMSRPHISKVITGALLSPNTKAAICSYLGVTILDD